MESEISLPQFTQDNYNNTYKATTTIHTTNNNTHKTTTTIHTTNNNTHKTTTTIHTTNNNTHKTLASFHTNYLTPCSTALLQKLTGSQLAKKFSAFYGIRSPPP